MLGWFVLFKTFQSSRNIEVVKVQLGKEKKAKQKSEEDGEKANKMKVKLVVSSI